MHTNQTKQAVYIRRPAEISAADLPDRTYPHYDALSRAQAASADRMIRLTCKGIVAYFAITLFIEFAPAWLQRDLGWAMIWISGVVFLLAIRRFVARAR